MVLKIEIEKLLMFRLSFDWKQNPFGALIYVFFLRSVRGDTGREAAAEVLRRSGQAREEETRRGGEGAASESRQVKEQDRRPGERETESQSKGDPKY